MAHFYGSMKGDRREVTRCGTKNSGHQAHIRGWNVGARVELDHVEGQDRVRIYKTGGSNSPDGELIAEYFAESK